MSDTLSSPSGEDNKGEYQIKSSGSDGIKITFNKTKSKGSKSTGLKPGVNSGPASKKSSSGTKSSSQKLLYSKSSSSSSLDTSSSSLLNFKTSPQSGKSSKDKVDGAGSSFASFSSNSNDMLKNMLNLASTGPDIMKAFDRKFQIPKLSATRGKSDDKTTSDETFNSMLPRSAPSTPMQSSTPSPTLDFMRDNGQFQMNQQKFLPQQQQQKFFEQNQNKKLFKSVSSEQIYGDNAIEKFSTGSGDVPESDFQAFLKAQARKSDTSMHHLKSPMQLAIDGNMNQAGDGLAEGRNAFNDNDLIDLNFGSEL